MENEDWMQWQVDILTIQEDYYKQNIDSESWLVDTKMFNKLLYFDF